MNRMLRWIGIAVAGLAGVLIVASAGVYALSERILRRTYEVPRVALTIPADPESVREGRRLATIHGCLDCHARNGEGRVLFDDPKIARIVAPNLTAAVRKYTDAQLAVVVRSGIRPDGRSLLVMPGDAFVSMTDADLGRIIAFLRSLPPVSGPEPIIAPGPLGRLGLVTGQFKTTVQLIAESVPTPAATSQEAELGRYLALTVCAECHGTSLHGASNPDFTSSDLRVVAAYSPEAFTRLLRTGIALGDRQLRTMSPYAAKYLSQLSDAEISALYRYLHVLPGAGN